MIYEWLQFADVCPRPLTAAEASFRSVGTHLDAAGPIEADS
jgi:hypothetical protein